MCGLCIVSHSTRGVGGYAPTDGRGYAGGVYYALSLRASTTLRSSLSDIWGLMSQIITSGQGSGCKVLVLDPTKPVPKMKRVFEIPLGATLPIGRVMFKVVYIRPDRMSIAPVDDDVELKEAGFVDLSGVKKDG